MKCIEGSVGFEGRLHVGVCMCVCVPFTIHQTDAALSLSHRAVPVVEK